MTLVSSVSEGQLLATFLPTIQEHNAKAQRLTPGARSLVLGPGDDSAVLDLSGGLTVMSTDTQTQNQDFRLSWPSGRTSGGYEVGWKAATQNLADIAAMGARPVTLLVSLTLPPSTPLAWVKDFARGLVDSCTAQGAETCSISGGDVGSGTEISVTVTALGLVQKPVTRSGAQAGDAIVLAGALGTAAAGLALLENSELPETLSPQIEACIEAQQRPVSPLAAGIQGAENLTSLMDVSDGLVRDGGRLAQASACAFDIDTASLAPWLLELREPALLLAGAEGQKASDLALGWVLTGGENHALLGTSPPEQIPAGFTRIGTVRPGTGVTVDGHPYTAKGWDHFEAGSR
ncbi:thiamine-phosphate kinase [Rothia sp. CCM 9417]|uniref:thiamine-phosphate kinase n=1 Tax=Rothia sp. CCM 9417 TaxID=3402657 RepID=UPI003AE46F91